MLAGCDGPTRIDFPIKLLCPYCFGVGDTCLMCIDGRVHYVECVCRLRKHTAMKVFQLWCWTERYKMMPHGGTPSQEPMQLMAAFQFIDRYSKALNRSEENQGNGK